MLVNSLAFTSVYFFGLNLFNGLWAIQIKNFAPFRRSVLSPVLLPLIMRPMHTLCSRRLGPRYVTGFGD